MKIYGLTGKSGAGKTTVANILKEKGFFVIDGDVAARTVTEKGSDVLNTLSEYFGKDIIDLNGNLKRQVLAQKAFSSKENTEALNRITHGAIDTILRSQVKEAEKAGFENCLIDAAALLESPSRVLCEKIIVVTAPFDVRLERIIKRDNITKQDAVLRMNAQKSDEYYFENADIIINNFPPHNLYDEIENKVTG